MATLQTAVMCATDLFSTFGSGMSDFMDTGQPHAAVAAVQRVLPCSVPMLKGCPCALVAAAVLGPSVCTPGSMPKAACLLPDSGACWLVWPTGLCELPVVPLAGRLAQACLP